MFLYQRSDRGGGEMNDVGKLTSVFLLVATVLAGCTYQREVPLAPVGLPEYIYATPTEPLAIGASAGVFDFQAPAYAGDMGRVAGECLYEELLKRGIFARLDYEPQQRALTRSEMLALAKTRGYELIITGDLLYYFEGSLHAPSRVDQRMEVIAVADNALLWYAKAVEIGPNVLNTDYWVAEGYGRSAPSSRKLMSRNAEKFCQLLHQEQAKNASMLK
jgi:hypothetical protein